MRPFQRSLERFTLFCLLIARSIRLPLVDLRSCVDALAAGQIPNAAQAGAVKTAALPVAGKLAVSPLLAQMERLRGARILLVEDNEMNQRVATELLQDAGFVVELAVNGAVALAMVQKATYDMVLMDMQMPVMNGVRATAAIRTLPGLSGLAIVAMTANAMQGNRDRCLAAGMNDYLLKPIDPDELWRTLLQWLPDRRETVRMPTSAAPATPEEAVKMDASLLAGACNELTEALSNDDTRAVFLFDQHRALLHAAFPDEFWSIAEPIRNFDFELALAALDRATRAHQTPH
jgi:CheY-like chemotaxis protein